MEAVQDTTVGWEETTTPMMDMGHGHAKIYYHTGIHQTILFYSWMTHNWHQMLGSCIGLFFIAMLYEGFKVGREVLQQRMTRESANTSEAYPVTTFKKADGPETYGSASSNSYLTSRKQSLVAGIFNINNTVQAVLHVVQVWISMSLMLVFMTFNIYLCLSISLGAGAGYFAFAWLQRKYPRNDEHCN